MTLILIATGQTIVVPARRHRPVDRRHAQSRDGDRRDPHRRRRVRRAAAVDRRHPRVGAVVGVLNGLLISVSQLQPFLVTLATWSILDGIALIILPVETASVPAAWFEAGNATVARPRAGADPAARGAAGLVGMVPPDTRLHSASARRARTSAAPSSTASRSPRTNVAAYGLSGFFAALAGLFFATQTGAGSPTVGTQYVLPSIAAVVIGGTSLRVAAAALIGHDRRRLHPDPDRRCRLPAQPVVLLAAGRVRAAS